mmetsp:Transcript_39343/g.88070  ORF Transcript_39343/g.88070 Transcript_39343/m.88070 type:complete len:158 (+) Transcript_39343:92-565(+)
MAVNAVSTLLISLMAVCPQLAVSDGHNDQNMVRVMCINETHHAYYSHDHDNDDEDDEDDEDDMNMSSGMSRRLAMHHDDMMNMSGWIVLETTAAVDPCGTEACNSTCNATSCHPMACMVPVPTTSTTGGNVADGARHAACVEVVLPLLASMLAFLSC